MWDSDSSGWDWQRSNTWSWSRPSQTIWSWSGAPLGQVAHCYLISIFGHFWIITAAVLFLISRAARMMLGWLMMLEFISWLEWMRICPHLRLPVMLTAHQEFSLAEISSCGMVGGKTNKRPLFMSRDPSLPISGHYGEREEHAISWMGQNREKNSRNFLYPGMGVN